MNYESIVIVLVIISLGFLFRKSKGNEELFANCKRKHDKNKKDKIEALEIISTINQNAKYVFTYKDHFSFNVGTASLIVFLGGITGDFSGYLMAPAAVKKEGVYIVSNCPFPTEKHEQINNLFKELLCFESYRIFLIKDFKRFSNFLELNNLEN